jgi:TonB family protein
VYHLVKNALGISVLVLLACFALPTKAQPQAAPAASCTQDVVARKKVTPEMPPSALRDSASGAVEVNVFVNESGAVTNVIVSKSGGRKDFDDAAMGAARTSLYSPAVRDCKPVAGTYLYTVTFESISAADAEIPCGAPVFHALYAKINKDGSFDETVRVVLRLPNGPEIGGVFGYSWHYISDEENPFSKNWKHGKPTDPIVAQLPPGGFDVSKEPAAVQLTLKYTTPDGMTRLPKCPKPSKTST